MDDDGRLEDVVEPEKWTPQRDPDGVTRQELNAGDWALQFLLDVIVRDGDDGQAHSEGSVGVTLFSGGVVVSGLVISEGRYVEAVKSQLIEGGMREDSAGAIATGLDKLGDARRSGRAARRKEDLPTRGRRWVHLKDAIIVNGQTSQRLPLWRGDLDAVTGWALGSFAAE